MIARFIIFAILIVLLILGGFLIMNRDRREPGPPFSLPDFDIEREGGLVFTFSVQPAEHPSAGSVAFKKRQTEGVVQHRLEAQGIVNASLRWRPFDGVPEQLEIAVAPLSTNIVQALKKSLVRSNPLQFHGVDIDNTEQVDTILREHKTPTGYKVVERQLPSDAQFYRFLMAWDEQDWRANPDAAKRLGVDPSSATNLNASLQGQAFQRAQADEVAAFMPTSKSDLMLKREIHDDTQEVLYEPIFIEVMSRMDGRYIRHAKVTRGSEGAPGVVLKFQKAGRKEFGELTSDFWPGAYSGGVDPASGAPIGRRLAIVLEGKLITAPVVNQPKLKGVAEITGLVTPEKAEQLANDLNKAIGVYPLELLSVDELAATEP